MEVSGQIHGQVALPPGERAHRYPLDRMLGGPQSRSGRCGEEKNLAPAGTRIPDDQPVARLYTDWAIRHSKNKISLPYSKSEFNKETFFGFVF
jgi:hypothetical protein